MNAVALEQQRYVRYLWLLLAAGALLRLGYVLVQPASDPAWNRPILDGEIYLDWARRLAAGAGSGSGAFYHAPLYPWALAAHLSVFGERFIALYAIQQGLVVAAAGFLAGAVRRLAGPGAALAAAGLFLFYAPTTYFASRPLGEALGLFLLLAAVSLVTRRSVPSGALAGLVVGLAILSRANFLLLPPLWATLEFVAGRHRRALVFLAGVLVVVGPVTVRNRVASGHWVPVAANSGLTAYHGNGPGALGIFTQPVGFSGDPAMQRDEARELASRAAGRALDVVEADRYWGRKALETRLADGWGTLRLGVRRMLLLVDSYEHGLDYPPAMDRNPLRLTLRVPSDAELGIVSFGLLLGLAAAGLTLRGFRGTGGGFVWSTLAACVATPLLFYVSSRYRLPAAAILTIPAGIGIAALVQTARAAGEARALWTAIVVAATTMTLSLAIPSQNLQRAERAAAWSNLASSWLKAGDLDAARTAADRAIALDPQRASARYNLGLVLQAEGRMGEAMAAYGDALERDPGLIRAARRLAGLLIDSGDANRALAVLRRVMIRRPDCAPCWSDSILARLRMNDVAGAQRTADEARGRGVPLDAEIQALLVAAVADGAPAEGSR